MKLLVVLCVAVRVAAADSHVPDPRADVPIQVDWDQKIAMRDGIKLSATVYRDPAQIKPVPAIVMLTPYIAAHGAKQGMYFAQHGYVFVAIDDRGRGNSEGTFVPSQSEGKDGYDAIEWVAKQPWCNGSVATWGGSWLGFTQWSIAREMPPHLKAMAPTASVYPGIDYPQPDGIMMSYALRWLSYVDGHASNDGLFGASDLWTNGEYQQVRTGRPFVDLDAITGIRDTVFRTWAAHPRDDEFWQAVTPRRDDFAKLHIPILTITGHYDDDQRGALTYYDRHMAYGPKDVTQRHLLVIGPWDHSGTRRPADSLGGVTFGPTAVPNMEELHTAWYDYVLKGSKKPELLKDRVACFIMGRNIWVYGPDLAHFESRPLVLHLDATGAIAGDVTHTGRLRDKPAAAASVVLTSDPKYLPARDQLTSDDPNYLRDQREVFDERPSRVVLTSAPLGAETVITGRAKVRLNITSDQPDGDMFVDLFEVLADGSSIFLSHATMRLRYRNGGVDGVPLAPGKPEHIELSGFTFFARALAKGSRVRIVIDNGPQFGWQRNSHTGGNLATEPASAGRIGKLTIATGADAGSVLELPRPDPSIVK